MRASGDLKPNASLVSNRIFVLTDSTSALDMPLSRGCVGAGPDAGDAAGEVDEGGNAAASRPGQPPVEGLLAGQALDVEDPAQAFLEQVGAVKTRVGLGDPLELLPLLDGEVFGFFHRA